MNISRRWLEAFLRRPLEAKDWPSGWPCSGAGVDAIEPLHPGLEPGGGRAGRIGAATSQRRPAEPLRGERRHRPTAQRGVRRSQRNRGEEVSLRPGGHDAARRARSSRSGKIRGETPRECSAPRGSLAWARTTKGFWSSTTDAAPGTRLLDALPLDDDRLVVDVAPNRPDLLGHKGVARELAPQLRRPVPPARPFPARRPIRRPAAAGGWASRTRWTAS